MTENIKLLKGISRVFVFLFLLAGFVLVLTGDSIHISLSGNILYLAAAFFSLVPFGFRNRKFKVSLRFWVILVASLYFLRNYVITYSDFVGTKFELPPMYFFIFRLLICIMLIMGFCFYPIDEE